MFAARIEPIFKSPDPSSCVQCHLASVDLKNYIRPSSRETFLSLRDQGLDTRQFVTQLQVLCARNEYDRALSTVLSRVKALKRIFALPVRQTRLSLVFYAGCSPPIGGASGSARTVHPSQGRDR